MATVRDKLWMFGSRAHDDDIWLGKSSEHRFTRWSRITPAEGAFMLDIPNMILVNSDGIPVPFSADAYGYAESFCRMKKVLWSITGSGGFRIGNEEEFICDLAEKYPNITGAFLDDYFNIFLTNDSDANERIYNDLKSIREKLSKANRPMELYVVWYTHHFQAIDPKVMQFIDGLTLWTWEYRNLKRISDNFEFTEKLFPDKKKLLGIYLLDYPSGMPVPNEYMELQCEYGLKLLKEGRADGLIICTNCVMGVGLPSEKWLRGWIERVKDIEIPD
ncbi:MAG: hypothetical protein ACOX3Q_09155 [Clostridia bacterium]|jgi:hypothetical protein|nr:hypothetical protein [Clostridiaceae bacterium]